MRLDWDQPGTKHYETGVSHGVLYVGASDGVAWPGLISVNEAPDGGSPEPLYQDGLKYRNVSASEEFNATINAFTCPREFYVCDGQGEVKNGLFAHQQPRTAFGLSYRTIIGNELELVEFGYKIHLVYNALTSPTQSNYTTVSTSPTPNQLSWSIETLPVSLTGKKSTAHFVIDSRYTPAGLLKAIEDILYGTATAAPRLPAISEIVTLFQSAGPLLYTNLASYPIGPTATSSAGWAPSPGETLSFVANDGGTPALEAFDPVGRGGVYTDPNAVFLDPTMVGKYFAVGADVKVYDYYDSQNFYIRPTAYSGGTVTADSLGGLATWKNYSRIWKVVRIDAAPNGSYIRGLLWPGYPDNQHPDPLLILHSAWSNLPSGVSWGAVGTGHDGTTEGSLSIPASATQVGIYPFGSNPNVGVPQYGVKVIPGEQLAISFWVKSSSIIPINGVTMYVRFYNDANLTTFLTVTGARPSVAIPANTWTEVKATITAPDSGLSGQAYAIAGLYKESFANVPVVFSSPYVMPLQRFRFRNYVMAMADTAAKARDAVLRPLSGDLPDANGETYDWAGTPNASQSTLKSWN